jgi:endonuclease/exonuclease/phosphatase (EEP) superfamily protein YafD
MNDTRPTAPLRVLTANLYAENLDVDGFAGLLEELAPDVAIVQELSFAAAEVLAGFLPHGMLSPEAGTNGRGLALRAPADMELLPMVYRDALIARLEPPEWPGSLEVINVHMANPIMWPPWRSIRARGRQLESLFGHMSSPGMRLVAGDFNATPVWPVYRQMVGRLEDAAVLVGHNGGPSPARTWGPTPGSPRLLRIDHVFVEGIKPVDARVVPLPGSDHSGLLVEVKLA